MILGIAGLVAASPLAIEAKSIGIKQTVSSYTLKAYVAKKFTVVNNQKNHVKVNYSYAAAPNYYSSNTYETTPNVITSKKAINGKKVTFKTEWFLPVTYQKSGDLGNAQALVIDGDNYYVTVATNVKKGLGKIVRYDMAGLTTYLQANFEEEEIPQVLRRYFKHPDFKFTNGQEMTAEQKGISDYIKVSEEIQIGHGQGLALNPKNKTLWLLQDIDMNASGKAKTSIVKINKQTLGIEHKVVFKLKDTVPMGHNLTFDKNGYAYFYTIASSGDKDPNVGWAKGNVKIYRGRFGVNQKATWQLVMQGIKYSPGTYAQSMSYNPAKHELMIISDSSIQSIPISKLGKLKPKDVRQTTFNTKREFETVTFDKEGYAYLLTLKGVEILKSTTKY